MHWNLNWEFKTGVGCHLLFQGIFQTQESNPYILWLLHCQADSFSTEPFYHFPIWEAPVFLVEKAMATHSSTLAWKIPWTEEPGRLQSMGLLRESDTTERLHFPFSLSCIGEGNGNPLQCSCLENPRDGEPGGLTSLGSHRVRHDWSDLAVAAVFLGHGLE